MGRALGQGNARDAVRGDVDDVSLPDQDTPDQVRESRLVFDQEDSHRPSLWHAADAVEVQPACL